jgi:SET domain-containing protein
MIEIKISALSSGEFNRGVFATRDVSKGELIHEAPVVPFPNEEYELIEKTTLSDYVFSYGANHSAILLGYGSLFNHSYTPNAAYELNFETHIVTFYAYTDIKAGEEILINYNGDVDCDDPLWFNQTE